MGVGMDILREATRRTPPFSNKLLGKDVRVRWGGAGWSRDVMWIEELPGEPAKRKVYLMRIATEWYVKQKGISEFSMANLVKKAKLKKSMNYDQMVKAMEGAVKDVVQAAEGKPTKSGAPFEFGKLGGKYSGMGSIFREQIVDSSEVESEDMEPHGADSVLDEELK